MKISTVLLTIANYAIVWAGCVLASLLLSLVYPLPKPIYAGTGLWVLYGFIDLLIPDENKLRNRWRR